MALDRFGRCTEISLRHEVGVEVVVGDRAVFVGTGDAVDPEMAFAVVVSQRNPEPRGFNQQLDSD